MLVLALALTLTAAQPEEAPGSRVTIQGASKVRECFEAAQSGRTSDGAVERCTEAMAAASGHPFRWAASVVNRGVIRYDRGEFALAAADFTAAIETRDPPHPTWLVNRGLAYERVAPGDAGFEAKARADYLAALQQAPGNLTAKRRLAELDRPFIERRLPRGRSVV